MAEVDNKQVKKGREAVLERLKVRYPDKDFSDDEAIFEQIDGDYGDYDTEIGGYKEREKGIVDLFDRNPSFAMFVADAAHGKDPWIAVIERLGIDGITDLLNNPEKQKEYAEANAKYVERLGKEKELEEEYNNNLTESLALLEQIQQEKMLSDDVMDAAYALINKIAMEAILGKYTAETVNMALNAITHDADVENARTEGTIAGKNAKIEEKIRKRKMGDGTPALSGSVNAPIAKNNRRSILEMALDEEKGRW